MGLRQSRSRRCLAACNFYSGMLGICPAQNKELPILVKALVRFGLVWTSMVGTIGLPTKLGMGAQSVLGIFYRGVIGLKF